MKFFFTILGLFALSFSLVGQKLDSAQFHCVYDNMTKVYTKNINSYLLKMAETEVSPVSDNASDDTKLVRRAAIQAKMKAYESVLKGMFLEKYEILATDLNNLGEDPKSYLTGFLDMAIRSIFPNLDEHFYRDNWKELIRVQDQL